MFPNNHTQKLKSYNITMKRYCQTLKLKDNEQLIAQYIEVHQNVWNEIKEGIKAVGILDMQIYIHNSTLFMIVETVDEFDWEKDNARLSTLPRQAEWEAYVSQFQQADASATSAEKWQLMTQIFKL